MSPSSESPRLERALKAYISFQSAAPPRSKDEFLAEHEELRDLLEPMFEDADADAGETRTGTEAGAGPGRPAARRRLGDFDVLGEIGRGGMGVVYEARQRSVDRTVALKVLTTHLTTDSQSIARFHREATLAGRLSHPGIVEVFTVGSEDDTHYFAMELVDGVSLDVVVRAVRDRTGGEPAKLTELGEAELRALVADRMPARGDLGASTTSSASTASTVYRRTYVESMVAIALHVAEALHHAHTMQVLHRDVKPSNVMLRRDGRVVIADFGLAREEGLPSMTMSGEFLGTPYYVSPEQAEGKRDRVGPGSDVFSVGAMLYEMVTLSPPFRGRTSAEVLHKLVHDEPVDPQKRNRNVPADLAAVILRCLEKDPLDRYLDAGELAVDLRALLELRPVRARRVSAGTRVARWAQRNRALATTALVAIVVLLLGSAVSTVIFYRQAASLEQSQRETHAVNEFLVEKLILATDPFRHRGKEPTVEAVLLAATEEVAASFEGQPRLEATVRHTLGKAWGKLGKFEEAKEQLELSRTIRRRLLPEPSLRRLETELEYALILREISDLEPAKRIAREVLAVAREHHGEDHELVLRAELLVALTNKNLDLVEEAERDMRAHWQHSAAVRGADDRRTLLALHHLGRVVEARGRLEEAEGLLREAMDRRRATLRPDHPDIQRGSSDLANLLIDRGNLDDAQRFAEEAIAGARRIYGEKHPHYLMAKNMLASVYNMRGRNGDVKEHYEKAERLYREALELREALYGKESASYARGLNNLGVVLSDRGMWEEAARFFARAHACYVATLGPEHRDTVLAQTNLIRPLRYAKKTAAALVAARQCAAASPRAFGPRHHIHGHALAALGLCLRDAKQYDEALRVLLESYDIHRENLKEQHPRTRRVALEISRTYRAMDDAASAAEWQVRSVAKGPASTTETKR